MGITHISAKNTRMCIRVKELWSNISASTLLKVLKGAGVFFHTLAKKVNSTVFAEILV